MVVTHALLHSLEDILRRLTLGSVTSLVVAKWAEKQFWELIEGKYKELDCATASFLRSILNDIALEWENVLGSVHDRGRLEEIGTVEFSELDVQDWVRQVGEFVAGARSNC